MRGIGILDLQSHSDKAFDIVFKTRIIAPILNEYKKPNQQSDIKRKLVIAFVPNRFAKSGFLIPNGTIFENFILSRTFHLA